MNLLLTSSSFSHTAVVEAFLSFAKEKSYSTIAIVTTAHPKKENSPSAKKTFEQLTSWGFKPYFVDFEKGEKMGEVDCIYVCGGNTFNLLFQARKANFGADLDCLEAKDGLYIGSSAGSILLSPDISATTIPPGDENTIGLEDIRGFNRVKFHMSVHYEDRYKPSVDEFRKIKGEQVETLRDGEAIFIKGDKVERIS